MQGTGEVVAALADAYFERLSRFTAAQAKCGANSTRLGADHRALWAEIAQELSELRSQRAARKKWTWDKAKELWRRNKQAAGSFHLQVKREHAGNPLTDADMHEIVRTSSKPFCHDWRTFERLIQENSARRIVTGTPQSKRHTLVKKKDRTSSSSTASSHSESTGDDPEAVPCWQSPPLCITRQKTKGPALMPPAAVAQGTDPIMVGILQAVTGLISSMQQTTHAVGESAPPAPATPSAVACTEVQFIQDKMKTASQETWQALLSIQTAAKAEADVCSAISVWQELEQREGCSEPTDATFIARLRAMIEQ